MPVNLSFIMHEVICHAYEQVIELLKKDVYRIL